MQLLTRMVWLTCAVWWLENSEKKHGNICYWGMPKRWFEVEKYLLIFFSRDPSIDLHDPLNPNLWRSVLAGLKTCIFVWILHTVPPVVAKDVNKKRLEWFSSLLLGHDMSHLTDLLRFDICLCLITWYLRVSEFMALAFSATLILKIWIWCLEPTNFQGWTIQTSIEEMVKFGEFLTCHNGGSSLQFS